MYESFIQFVHLDQGLRVYYRVRPSVLTAEKVWENFDVAQCLLLVHCKTASHKAIEIIFKCVPSVSDLA